MPRASRIAGVFAGLDAAKLRARTHRTFKAGGGTAPAVRLVRDGTSYAVFKDYAPTGLLFAWLLAPLLVWREKTALAALADVDGVPRLIRAVGARALLIEYIAAEPLPEHAPTAATFAQIEACLARIHAAGVAHADLRAARNILVDAAGQPYIIDFVARVRRGRAWNRPWNRLFREFVDADRRALAKHRVRFSPEIASAADRRCLVHQRGIERGARAFGRGVRRLTRVLARSPR